MYDAKLEAVKPLLQKNLVATADSGGSEGALHSALSGLSDVGADRQFAGMAFDKMRRPGTKRA